VVRRGPRALGHVFGKRFVAQRYRYMAIALAHRSGGLINFPSIKGSAPDQ